jgi:hypothetical protein
VRAIFVPELDEGPPGFCDAPDQEMWVMFVRDVLPIEAPYLKDDPVFEKHILRLTRLAFLAGGMEANKESVRDYLRQRQAAERERGGS